MAIASRPINSILPPSHPPDAPFETILDLWYTVLGEAVLDYSYEDLVDNVPGDWLMDNIRRVVARLVRNISSDKWAVANTPYTVYWQWSNASQKVQAVLKLTKVNDGNFGQQSARHTNTQP